MCLLVLCLLSSCVQLIPCVPTFSVFSYCSKVFCCVKILVSLFLAPWVLWQNNRPKRIESSGAPLRRVRRGILQADRGDRGARPPPVPARGLLSPPHGPPRHHRIVLERRDLLISGKCPGLIRNQPAVRGSLKLPAVRGEVCVPPSL